MKPLYERILIKPLEKETTTASGIMLPEKAVKRPNLGIVVSAGPGTKHQPMAVKAGDKIICNRFAGLELMYKGEKHYVVLANEVIAVLDSFDDVDLEEYE